MKQPITTIDPPDTDEDGDGDDGLYLSVTFGAGVYRNTSMTLPENASLDEIANGLLACLRGMAASVSPALHGIVNAMLVDSALDAAVWINTTDVGVAPGGGYLTTAILDEIDRRHRRSWSRPLQAVRVGLDGEILTVNQLRAALKAAGR